ncbi:MAG: hypothetical protein MK160_08895 [Rhodobacteraceae bacterium]|nr:hypothetical protein [Paracoccaceae bacterium]
MSIPLIEHHTTGRTVRAALVLLGVYLGLLLLWHMLHLYWVFVCVGLMLTLPAAWEFATAKPAGLRLDATTLSWFSGARRADIAVQKVDHIRFDTRLDLSIKVTVVLADKRKLRIPHDSLPPHPTLMDALDDLGVKTTRNHLRWG